MNHYEWTNLRDQFSRDVGGETPGPQLEEDLIVIFKDHPAIVKNAMDEIIAAYDEGKINSGWAVLRRHLQVALKPTHVTADDAADKQRAIKRAQTWLKNCGIHFDRPTEITAELFDRGGILEPWADDELLKRRIVDAWHTARPAGAAIEHQDQTDLEQFTKSHTCERCGKLIPFKLQGCPHCQHNARIAQLTEQHQPKDIWIAS